MAEIASAFVSIVPSARGFGSELTSQTSGEIDSAGKKMGSRLGSAMKTGLLLGGAALAVGVTSLVASSVDAASQAQQAVGGVEAVFGKYAKGVLADSKRAAQGLGLSSTAYNELITVSGAMLKNKGLTDFAKQSENLIGVGADLSAMFGGSTKDAVDALNSAMRGESDPIERYGISLNETAVKAELASKGQDKLTGAALEQAKTQARLTLIQRQSADAQGAFGRESNTLAGQQARLSAQFDNIKVTVGTGLLPILTRLAGFVNSTLLPAIGNLGPVFSRVGAFFAPVIAQIRGAFSGGSGGGILAGLIAFGTTIQANIVPVLKTMAATFTGTILPAITTLASYLATKLVPVFTQVAGIITSQVIPIVVSLAQYFYGTLVPAVVEIARNVGSKLRPVFEQLVATFRSDVLPTVQKALAKFQEWQPTIQKVISAVVKILGKFAEFNASVLSKVLPPLIRFAGFSISNLIPAISAVITVVGKIIGKVIDFGGALVDAVQSAGRFLSGVRDKIGSALDFIGNIPGKIKDVFAGAGNLLKSIGGQIVDGLTAGIRAAAGAVTSAVNAIIDKIPKFIREKMGISSPSKVTTLLGVQIMDGLALGMQQGGKKVRDALERELDAALSKLSTFKSDFASLASSVSGAFVGDLFGVTATEADTEAGVAARTVGQNFIDGLMGKKAELAGLLKSFKTLKGWGLDPAFLSQLFASGNGALITELAGMGKGGAKKTANLFGDVTSLGDKLGGQVATNDIGPDIREMRDEIITLRKAVEKLPKAVKDGTKEGSREGTREGSDERSGRTRQRERAGR